MEALLMALQYQTTLSLDNNRHSSTGLMRLCVQVGLITYLPTYLPAYLPTCLLTYLPIYLPAYLPTCLLTYLPTYLPAYLPTCLFTYLPIYLPAYLPTCLPVLKHIIVHRNSSQRRNVVRADD